MEKLLLYVIVLLPVAIFALGGFWFYRASQERRARAPQPARPAAKHDRWEGAVRASRDRV
jgi:hypothetical protein